MFSGTVFGKFPVVALNQFPEMIRYGLSFSEQFLAGLQVGASVALDGVCQTAVEIKEGVAYFEAIGETLEKTTLDELALGRLLNAERSLRFGDEVGGHLLSGHIFGTAKIASLEERGSSRIIEVACPKEWIKYVFSKGFVGVDGVSLTVGEVGLAGRFTLHLISETLKRTTLGHKRPGDRLNLELDPQAKILVDTIERREIR